MLLYVVFIYSFIFQLRIALFMPCEEYVNYGDYSHSFRAFLWAIYITKNVDSTIHLAPVVQKVDSAIHRINHYPVEHAIGFPNTYPLDSDLSGG